MAELSREQVGRDHEVRSTFVPTCDMTLTSLGGFSPEAVNLGGSRARGDFRPDSDWDFAVYYRGEIDPRPLEELG
jgi:Polymerase beta, Nucleotidyltransferase